MPFIDGSIRLVLSPYDLVIAKFSDLQYPRVEPQFPELSYSQAGTPNLSGSAFDPKYLWDITCILNEADANTLNRMHQYSYRNNLEVLIHDYTLEIVETTQTRNTAADASTSSDGTQTSYYARFRALFTSPLSMTKSGANVICSFTMGETSKTAPP